MYTYIGTEHGQVINVIHEVKCRVESEFDLTEALHPKIQLKYPGVESWGGLLWWALDRELEWNYLIESERTKS